MGFFRCLNSASAAWCRPPPAYSTRWQARKKLEQLQTIAVDPGAADGHAMGKQIEPDEQHLRENHRAQSRPCRRRRRADELNQPCRTHKDYVCHDPAQEKERRSQLATNKLGIA